MCLEVGYWIWDIGYGILDMGDGKREMGSGRCGRGGAFDSQQVKCGLIFFFSFLFSCPSHASYLRVSCLYIFIFSKRITHEQCGFLQDDVSENGRVYHFDANLPDLLNPLIFDQTQEHRQNTLALV
jgi:hypothetical protein